MTTCEVWGSPIAHSRSPQLHAAAYTALGLDWHYRRREVDEAGFADAWAEHSPHVRGLSLTMPLKARAHAIATWRDAAAQRTGAVNTLVPGEQIRGFNTDVGGLAAALRESRAGTPLRVRVLGAGATAASAVAAVTLLGAEEIEIAARRPAAARALVAASEGDAVTVTATALTAPDARADLTISTLPVDTTLDPDTVQRLIERGGDLYDVTYGGWPGALATAWLASGAAAHSGLGMLLHQALLQVRIFVAGSPEESLDRESEVLAAMRHAVVGD